MNAFDFESLQALAFALEMNFLNFISDKLFFFLSFAFAIAFLSLAHTIERCISVSWLETFCR